MKSEKYLAQAEEKKTLIRKILDSGKAKLSPNLFSILNFNKTPREKILEYLENPELKLMDLDHLLWNLCPHDAPKIQSGDSSKCSECKALLGGWWCPDSPDNSCYYSSEKDKSSNSVVKLEDGREIPLDKDHDPEYETSDDCLFCHQPDERK